MKDLTVDRCVLFDANGVGKPSHGEPSRKLMMSMKDEGVALLTLDDEDLILTQYRNGMDGGSFGMQWVEQMLSKGQVHRVHRARIDRGTNKRLQEAHLDREDYKYYVRTAAATDYRKIVTRDPDYSRKIQAILKKRLSLTVSNAQGVCDHLHL